jgi:acrosin
VRYDQQTDTTVIGALTNSGITVSNKDASQDQELKAGQLLVVVKGRFQGLYDFDLQNFYQTSDLVQGLDLTKQNLTSSSDPAIASVQAEIVAALAGQAPLTGQEVIENPSFLNLTASADSEETTIEDLTADLNASPIDTFVSTGEILFNNAQELVNTEETIPVPENSVVSNPIDRPITTEPTTTEPTTTEPTTTEPTTTEPTTTEPTTPEPTTPEPTTPEPTTTEPTTTEPTTTEPTTTEPTTTEPRTTEPTTTEPTTTEWTTTEPTVERAF